MKKLIDRLDMLNTIQEKPPAPGQLLECLMELFCYTGYLAAPATGAAVSAETARQNFQALLAEAEAQARRAGFTAGEWENALFAACAWIDEQLLCSGWPGRDRWPEAQLQRQLFDTTNAGIQFYERLEHLSKSDVAVREVYDFCLSLGFKGQYFMPQEHHHLGELTTANRRLAAPNALQAVPKDVFPEAYAKSPKPVRRRFGYVFRLVMNTLLIMAPVIVVVTLYLLLNDRLNQIIVNYFKAAQ